ncbi:hypothetical protein [Bacillus sp. EB01]|nr:hypothetical protein [Bacillus sp. EB01]
MEDAVGFRMRDRVKASSSFQKAMFGELDPIIRNQPEKSIILFLP